MKKILIIIGLIIVLAGGIVYASSPKLLGGSSKSSSYTIDQYNAGTLQVGGNASSTSVLYCNSTKGFCYINGGLAAPSYWNASGNNIYNNNTGIVSIGGSATSTASLYVNPSKGLVSVLKTYNFDSEYNIGNSGTTTIVSFANGGRQKITMTGNDVISLVPPFTPSTMILKVIQGASGYNLNFSTSTYSVYFPYGQVPTLSSSNGAVDLFSLYWDGTAFWGVVSQNLTAL